MASRNKKPEPGRPQLPPEQALVLLRKQIDIAKALLGKPKIEEAEFGQFELVTKNVLEKAFGTNSPNVTDFENVARVYFYTSDMGESWWAKHRKDSLQTQIPRLEGLAELMETELQLRSGPARVTPTEPAAGAHRIFLVHGHNEAALNEVARFLEKLRQDVVVLREKPNRGQTIIEKFEEHAENVGFAVVLLTADDNGATANAAELNPRARQNVVFELGYFIGRLRRHRVCALYQPGVELPSDYSGVLYHELDRAGNWRLALARELKAAGLPIDMNLAL